jgi:hypothetical protein
MYGCIGSGTATGPVRLPMDARPMTADAKIFPAAFAATAE